MLKIKSVNQKHARVTEDNQRYWGGTKKTMQKNNLQNQKGNFKWVGEENWGGRET